MGKGQRATRRSGAVGNHERRVPVDRPARHGRKTSSVGRVEGVVRCSARAWPDRAVRRIVLLLGVFVGAVAAGVAGLLAPVSVSSPAKVTGCGSAAAPDPSLGQAEDERGGAGKLVVDAAAPERSHMRQCLMDLDDRRIWMTTLAVVGALALVAVVVFGGVTKQSPLSQKH
jgi:hypothetical protein